MEALKPAANGHYLMWKSLDYIRLLIRLDHFLVPMQSTGNLGCFPQGKRAAIVFRRYPFFVCYCVQCFHFSVIHRTLTWTVESLTCVCSYACVYTQGWGTPTTSQHNILTWKNSQIVLVLQTGFEPLAMESVRSRGQRSTNWATTSMY